MNMKQLINDVKEEIILLFCLVAFVTGMEFGTSYSFYSGTTVFTNAVALAVIDSISAAMTSAGGLGILLILGRLAGYEVSKIQ